MYDNATKTIKKIKRKQFMFFCNYRTDFKYSKYKKNNKNGIIMRGINKINLIFFNDKQLI